ncbi:MAG: PorT family protein [Bacteroidales bacterium]|nr:PorT family protein [Bacteroidales bacterium]
MKNIRMKSVLLFMASVLTLNLCMLGTAQAQVALGIKVAGNRVNYQKLTKGDFGLETGIFLRLGQNFYFQPEVNYAYKNSTFTNDANDISSTNEKLKQHFVAVPALLGYHFINKENFKFHLTFGPRFDFRISDNLEGTDWNANSLQWGAQVGLGFDIWRFTLDANYCFAADNFHNTITTVTQTKFVNTIIISLGFKILK